MPTNHFISLTDAVAITARYRTEKNAIIDSQYRGDGLLLNSETFDRSAIDALLAQTGCTKIRVYYGMHEDLKVRAVMVAVNDNDQDMVPGMSEVDYKIVQNSNPCPPYCPPPSPLNQD